MTKKTVPLLLLAGSMLLVAESPASAHASRIIQGNDYADINSSHRSGYVCDREDDGRLTYVAIRMVESSAVYNFWDVGGPDGTCDPFTVTTFMGTPVRWAMCERATGTDPCTGFARL
ncbi:MAG: hypothetical protein ACRD2C_18055 [Acidimicrobiales bacterium]